MSDDDLIEFADELDAGVASAMAAAPPWRVVIIDDEPDVHQTTELAVGDAIVLGRPLQFLHAYSAAEGKALLTREHDIAVILLDVVMEAPDAGLRMVETIRHQLGLDEVRIILRTGQAGYAPEIDAIRDFDINDYKTKSDLTRSKLYTALTAAIRSYQQIVAINASRRGLEMILRASSRLVAIQGVNSFAEGAVTQLASLLQVSPEGIVCVRNVDAHASEPQIVAAAGRYAGLMEQPLAAVPDERVRAALTRSLAERRTMVSGSETVLFLGSSIGADMAVFLDLAAPLAAEDEHLVAVFCNNMAACFDNVRLFSQLNASAYLDVASKLPNRNALAGLIDQARESGATDQALVLADIVQFSSINHAFGHEFGDKVLAAFAQRLSDHFGGHVVVARIGGDTFGLFGPEERIAPPLLFAAMAEPLRVGERDMHVRVTLGVLRLADAVGTGSDALKDANIALHEAKLDGQGGVCYFTRDMLAGIHERVRLLDALRAAFEDERLHVVYQPQMALDDGRLVGIEALLRWRTDDGQFVPPDQFVPLAEQSGLIVGLGEWVLRSACRETVALKLAGHPVRLSVNVSVAQLRSPRFLTMLDAAIEDSGIDPAQLELEITESTAMRAIDEVRAQFAQIRRRGVSVALDDFGSGYTSLAHLDELGVSCVKIDRVLINKLTDDNYLRSVTASITQLAHDMRLRVIAKGIETESQRQWLVQLSVDEGQGWLLGRPMPSDALRAWLKR